MYCARLICSFLRAARICSSLSKKDSQRVRGHTVLCDGKSASEVTCPPPLSYPAGRVVLTGAPLEVSTALIFEGVLDGVLQAETAGRPSSVVLGHLPTFVIGSVLYGAAFALVFWAFVHGRGHARAVAALGPASRPELLLVFVMTALLCYTTSIDSVDVPWLIGFFACVCCAIATQVCVRITVAE